MQFVPTPSQWIQYEIAYYLSKEIKLKIYHLITITIALISFTAAIWYYAEITHNTESIVTYHKLGDDWICESIGSRSGEYNFKQPTFIDGIYAFGDVNYEQTLYLNTTDTTSILQSYIIPFQQSDNISMIYEITKGNAPTLKQCKQDTASKICNISLYPSNFTTNIDFWYYTTINLDLSILNIPSSAFDNTGMWLMFFIFNNKRNIGYMPYLDFNIPLNWYSDQVRVNSLMIHNFSTYFYSFNNYSNFNQFNPCKYFFESDIITPYLCNKRECDAYQWFFTPEFAKKRNISIYEINSDAVQCVVDYNKSVASMYLEEHLFDYNSDDQFEISNGEAMYVQMYNLDIWSEDSMVKEWSDVCSKYIVNEYCKWVDVSPYSCHRIVKKTMLEVLALSFSVLQFVYTGFMMIIALLLMKCCAKNAETPLKRELVSEIEANLEMQQTKKSDGGTDAGYVRSQ